MVKHFGLAQLLAMAAVHADALWVQLERHEKRHGCAALIGVSRPYCPLNEELHKAWHRAFLWKKSIDWLLDTEGTVINSASLMADLDR